MLSNLQAWWSHFEYHRDHPLQPATVAPGRLSADDARRLATLWIPLRAASTSGTGGSTRGTGASISARQTQDCSESPPALRDIRAAICAEERRHAALLTEYLIAAKVVRRALPCLDAVSGHDGLIQSMLAQLYFRTLEASTGDAALQSLCRVVAADRITHVAFESELWLARRAALPLPSRTLRGATLALRFAASTVALWTQQRTLLRAGGHSAATFARAATLQYRFYLGARYRPPIRPAGVADCM